MSGMMQEEMNDALMGGAAKPSAPDVNVAAFGEAMHDALMALPDSERFRKAKQALMDEIWLDLEYSVIGRMPEVVEGFVRDMASRTVKEMLEGRDDQVRRYLSLDGYTGREHRHEVIHGTLFEAGAIALRKKIAQAHADLIQNERIKDLEAQVASLVAQVCKKDAEIERLRERSRDHY